MKFQEAFQLLMDGEYVTRESLNGAAYFVYMPHMKFIWKITTVEPPQAGTYPFAVEDFLAEDWKVVSRKEETTTESILDDVGDESDLSNAA